MRNNITISLMLFVLVCSAIHGGCSRSKTVSAPKENVLRLAIDSKVPTLDPHDFSNAYSAQVMSASYENLYEYHYLKRPFTPIPALAEGMPVVSKDKKTIRINLKKGVKFQDDPCFENGKGREFKASDVVYSYERMASPKKLRSSYSGLEGLIVGIDEFHSGKAKTIAGIRAVDDYAIEMIFTKAQPRFIYNLVDMHGAIVPKECAEKYGDGFASHPVGTGAYKFVEVNLGSKIVAVRNSNYRNVLYPSEGMPDDAKNGLLADAGKTLPFIDKIVFEVITESQPRWLKFLAGELETSGIPKDNMSGALVDGKLAPDLASRGIQHFRQIRSDITVESFNMHDPIWGKSKDLRHAYALALDVDKIIEMQYSGQAIRAQSIVDPQSYGFDPTFKSKWAHRDVKLAKELLVKAGYPEGKGLPPILSPINSGSEARQMHELMERQLREVGFSLKTEPLTWPEFEARGRSGNFAVLGLGFSSSVPDFDDSASIVHSRFIPTGQNLARYSNAEIDRLVDEIGTMENSSARLAKIRRVMDILDDEMPYLWMVHRIANQLVQPWVKNHVFTDIQQAGGFAKYKRLVLAQ